MKSRVWLALFAAGLTAVVAAADDVHLTNGESFEGVIAERDGDRVSIRLEFGELKLPAASVARIDSSPSALREYLDRRRELLARPAPALEWLELGHWARSRNLEHGYREALLEAAAIDPSLEELRPGMRDLEYVFDEQLDRWTPYAEYMSRAGMVRHRGEWVRPEQHLAESQPAPSDHQDVEETLSRTVELFALAELERQTRETRQTTRSAPTVPYGFPVAHFGGGWFFGPVSPPPGGQPPPDDGPEMPVTPDDLFTRPPGSLLPVGGANSGVRFRQPGSLLPVKSSRR